MATRWLESMDLMYAEMSFAHAVIVAGVQEPLHVLAHGVKNLFDDTTLISAACLPCAALASWLIGQLPP